MKDNAADNGQADEEMETDVWSVECSDDERYGPVKGVWEPAPADIRAIYEQLAEDKVPVLEWKCLPRRDPEREETQKTTQISKPRAQLEPEPDKKQIMPEFEFDDDMGFDATTPRRTPGSSKTPRQPKRVACMDKIMDDLKRHKKLSFETRHSPSTPGFANANKKDNSGNPT